MVLMLSVCICSMMLSYLSALELLVGMDLHVHCSPMTIVCQEWPVWYYLVRWGSIQIMYMPPKQFRSKVCLSTELKCKDFWSNFSSWLYKWTYVSCSVWWLTKLLLYLILSSYLSVCFSAFQYPSPYYLGATVRLRSSAMTFSTWSVQRSLADLSYWKRSEESTEVSHEGEKKEKEAVSCWSHFSCAHPVWLA